MVVQAPMRTMLLLLCVAPLLSCATGGDRCTTAPSATDQVRRELEQAYARNEAAFVARDVDAVMKLRHRDFHTVDNTGKLSTRRDMHERTRSLIERIERFNSIRETIRTLELHGDTAIVTVLQETSRAQRLPDGALHQIDTSVTQREWWRCTTEGWQMWRVDEVEEGTLLIDGKPPA
jgi:ketosteroid isomerase-like protein